jgi:cell surface protein SprA
MMFIHAESVQGAQPLNDGDLNAVIRIGSDFSGNYYEVKIPLKITPFGATDSLAVWPAENNLDFDLSELTKLKIKRNDLHIPSSQYYRVVKPDGRSFAILGDPNLGEVRGMLLSIENVKLESVCTEVWFNELRFSHLNESGGWAALGRIDLRLADLGTLTVSGAAKSHGFGTLEQRINERSKEDVYTIDISANIDAGKLIPKKAGLQIPIYAGISRNTSTPLYDPYDLDIKLKDKINRASSSGKDSIRNDAIDVTTIKTVNLTNVKKLKTDGKRPKVWSVSNFDLSYSYIETQKHNPLIENDELRRTRGAVTYNYAPQQRFIEPFKRLLRNKSPWLAIIKDFNFNYTPSQISVKADVFRQFGALRPRNVGGGLFKIAETYDKYFTFDRYYIMQWNFTRSLSLDFSATNNARIDEPYGRIDTKEKKDSLRKNFLKGGRNTQYHQEATLSYNVPVQKIPFLNWTTLRATYGTKYNWLAASLLTRSLGNTLSNTQTKSINGELKFEELYLKSKFLRAVYNDMPKQNNPITNTGKGNKPDTSKTKQKRIKDPNLLPVIGAVPKFFLKLLTSLKRVGIQYTEDYGTSLPGYLDSTQVLGYNLKSGQPGLGFIFGYQPDTNWINRFGAKGLLSRDSLVSALIQQRYNQKLNITAQISPFRDFTIDVNLDKTFDKQYSELLKDTSGTAGLRRLNPYALGSFNVSYIAFQTMFKKFDPNIVSETFKQFEANRVLLAGKLAKLNPYPGIIPDPNDPGYFKGYGRYTQDVVIPAFIAAYTNKDPMSVKLTKNSNPNIRANPFSGIIPRPNWTLTYNGLSRVKGLDKIFTNFTLRHGYHSSLSMNSFNTALLFQDPLHAGYPYFRDTLTGNLIPYFLVPNITIQEAFDPLIEVDMTFTNQLTTRFEFKKSRQLSLSLIDYQLAENRSTEVTVGLNWHKKGVPIIRNIRIGKNGMKLDNDVTFRFDFSYRDDATSNSKLDQKTSFGTAGQKVIRIGPSINYVLNNRVQMEFYFQQGRSIPKISNAFPITNTKGGVKVRISLNQ